MTISQHEHTGNWLRSEPDTRSLAIRQTFLDRRHQQHADLHIERIDDQHVDPAPVTTEELYLSLLYAGLYVKGVASIGSQWATRQSKWPNVFTAELEADGSVRFVIAHRDPGTPNWLDTAGHHRGTVGVRWVGPDVVDVLPTTRVVRLDSLA